MSKTPKDIIAAASLPERVVSVCVRGDLLADIDALSAELAAELADAKATGRLAGRSKVTEKAKEINDAIEAKRAEMVEHTLTFRLQALKPSLWRSLVAKYPPAKGSGMAVDLLGFMGEAIPASTISPELDEDDWRALLIEERLPVPEVGKLIDAVWDLNVTAVDVPKSLLRSGATSTVDGA